MSFQNGRENTNLLLLNVLCVQLQGVELDGEGAGVFHCDLSFSLSAVGQTGAQLKLRWAELQLRLLTYTACGQMYLVAAFSHADHQLPAVNQLQKKRKKKKPILVFSY